ncbi:MAG: tetratricopeptide repeat protein [Micavibrio sp.]|nr:MAG: tetratricopeptide repeat protein [Micavibrio sp.]
MMSQIFQKPSLFALIAALFFVSACVHQDTQRSALQGGYAAQPSYLDDAPATLTGAYLAGRFAQHQSDWTAASHYMHAVLQLDEQNKNLLHRTFLLALGDGDIERATQLAVQLIKKDDGAELATVHLVALAMAENRLEDAWALTENLVGSGFNDYAKPLFQAWLLVMMGNPDIALARLEEHIGVFNRDPVYLQHAGLIAEYAQNSEKAESYYSEVLAGGEFTVHVALGIAGYYERNNMPEKAALIYNQVDSQRNPYRILSLSHMADMIGRAAENPLEAVSLMLFELSSLLYDRQAYDSALIYTRLAEILTPSSPFVAVMLGDIAMTHSNYDAAFAHYSSVDDISGMMRFARLKAVETLEASGRKEEAVAILSKAAEEENEYADALIYLGDLYRRHEEYAQAVQAYNRALRRIGDVGAEHWFIIYARGMSQERLKNWDMAEKDLLKALELNPDHPLILNYLGYSWIDQGIHMERAMEMIKKAVMLRPNDGYITDSYGWALYKKGEYDEAVQWLEYSVERVPYDPTINDHLGDAYWRVGRRVEARFQWERAYGLSEDGDEKKRLRYKINFGLPDYEKPPAEPKTITVEREAMLQR